MIISEKEVEKLANLARIELGEKEEKELGGDLEKILEYFEELKEVDTKNVEPMSGGTFLVNVHRHDDENLKADVSPEEPTRAFPEREGNFLKIPPVFE